MKYLNTLVSMVDLAQRNFGMVRRDLQMHQTILETWVDSDNITAVNAQKDLRHHAKWWHNHSTTSYQGSEAI